MTPLLRRFARLAGRSIVRADASSGCPSLRRQAWSRGPQAPQRDDAIGPAEPDLWHLLAELPFVGLCPFGACVVSPLFCCRALGICWVASLRSPLPLYIYVCAVRRLFG